VRGGWFNGGGACIVVPLVVSFLPMPGAPISGCESGDDEFEEAVSGGVDDGESGAFGVGIGGGGGGGGGGNTKHGSHGPPQSMSTSP